MFGHSGFCEDSFSATPVSVVVEPPVEPPVVPAPAGRGGAAVGLPAGILLEELDEKKRDVDVTVALLVLINS